MLLIIMLGLQANAIGEIIEEPVGIDETIEPAIIIKNDEPVESIRLPNGDIHYQVQFFGKDYCVRVTEPDPLDSFDIGATYSVPCN